MDFLRVTGLVLSGGLALSFVAGGEAPGAHERQVFFGDLHVHTGWSFDAYIENTKTTPEDAYRYARGEEIPHKVKGIAQLDRPLDFLAVTDHAEYYGVFPRLDDPNSAVSKHPMADVLTSGDRERAVAALQQMGLESYMKGGGKQMAPDDLLYDERIMRQTWKKTVAIADQFYQPGEFTTFAGFEWSSTPTLTTSLHRNVIFRDTEYLPERPYSMIESNKPEDLWSWMERQRENGSTLLAIPHNPNISGGQMFALQDSDGDPIDEAYAKIRAKNEPIVEVAQIKGQSMIHPNFAPDEAYSDFGVFHFTYFTWGADEVKRGSYVRPGLQRGLQMQQQTGVNPFQFGFIGSTDSHNSNSPVQESEYSRVDALKKYTPGGSNSSYVEKAIRNLSGGLACVWAEENSRGSIYDALVRKEAYATTGPRMTLRVFGGWDFDSALLDEDEWVKTGYAKGVPMGQQLPEKTADAPRFLVSVKKDPKGANLDRVQVIKGWIDADGNAHDRVYDVAWSGERELDAETGEVPPVGNTVNVEKATYENSIGAEALQTVWHDPNFDPAQHAFYYVRVLEIPTPRWSTYDAVRLGINPPKDVPPTIQERAWSSPIWYGAG